MLKVIKKLLKSSFDVKMSRLRRQNKNNLNLKGKFVVFVVSIKIAVVFVFFRHFFCSKSGIFYIKCSFLIALI